MSEAGPSFWCTKAAFYRLADLSPVTGWIYMALLMIANKEQSSDFEASDRYIAKYAGASPTTVRTHVRLLFEHRLIGFRSGARAKGPKGFVNNTYTIASTHQQTAVKAIAENGVGDQQNSSSPFVDNKEPPTGGSEEAAGAGPGCEPARAAADQNGSNPDRPKNILSGFNA